jgi:hypothetical protein
LIGAAIAPALATGVVARSEALRFQVHAFAPILLLGLLGAWCLIRRFRLSGGASVAATILLALAVVRPDRGVAIVFRDYGPTSEPFAFEVAPDHQGAGRFVLTNATPDDLIVAEDSTEQKFYGGRVDYWLRRPQDAASYLASESTGTDPYDIYTGAELLPDFDALLKLSASQPGRLIWLITSAEADSRERFYRTPETSRALERIRPFAQFTGRDGMTRVYRIRAGRIEAPQVPPRNPAPVDGGAEGSN